MQPQVMLDLETLGQRPGCVIASIGAVIFGGGEIRGRFERLVDLESCVRAGLQLDAATVQWWLQQSDEALRKTFATDVLRHHLNVALLDFNEFIPPDACLWGNGADFDNAILLAAYEAAELRVPWHFRHNRCYRTVRALHPQVPFQPLGVKHTALADAEAQARHLMQILPQL